MAQKKGKSETHGFTCFSALPLIKPAWDVLKKPICVFGARKPGVNFPLIQTAGSKSSVLRAAAPFAERRRTVAMSAPSKEFPTYFQAICARSKCFGILMAAGLLLAGFSTTQKIVGDFSEEDRLNEVDASISVPQALVKGLQVISTGSPFPFPRFDANVSVDFKASIGCTRYDFVSKDTTDDISRSSIFGANAGFAFKFESDVKGGGGKIILHRLRSINVEANLRITTNSTAD